MPSWVEPALVLVLRETTSLVPSGDQPGSNAVNAVVALPVFSASFIRCEPSGWTVYRDPKCSNTIWVPSGDQLPSSSQKPPGVIRCRPVPSTLTTYSAALGAAQA